ncbi:ATP12 family protein [uncultured Erythrobacter sp.]|uniref:ATP12 family chaperone protein n=1 Tax=uncultured Erythrobacter sp. TaxID=263913 RepID=UPI002622CC06|nr:ATP12 family protein [uncultured Erythrobacter sp.]
MKRFYKDVATHQVDGGWQVTLDKRGIKTVKGAQQILPTRALAEAMAQEWDAQGEKLDPTTLPMRDMADYALDIVAPDVAAIAETLTAFGDTDTLLYRADPDEPLYARQQEVWEPIVAEFEQREGVRLTPVSGIMHRPQSADTLTSLRAKLETSDPFTLAGIEAMTSLSASLVVGLSALEPDIEPLTLWEAASLEEEWQADLWGRDAEAETRRAKREGDFLKACEFTRLARLPS